jgi:hypothetical protein
MLEVIGDNSINVEEFHPFWNRKAETDNLAYFSVTV